MQLIFEYYKSNMAGNRRYFAIESLFIQNRKDNSAFDFD